MGDEQTCLNFIAVSVLEIQMQHYQIATQCDNLYKFDIQQADCGLQAPMGLKVAIKRFKWRGWIVLKP
ncbi:MAG: hypothetical protein EZS28_033927 [Streblomastix strix]|uniref:Uncharacterized protein n=1 Tax=Streblomastix strix TaxID=222440 RepID=A0A5J4UJB4_9EUKA|nr:MAG: hypothetical protein EZS28_033927 [Streblomastix strix]